MKCFLKGVLLALLAVGLICGGSYAEDLLEQVKKEGVLKVSTDPNYAPQSFLNTKGELEGFDIDVAREVAKRLGVEVEFVTPEWDMITSGKWGARWDISIGSMTPTEERKKVLWFTQPYYYTPAQFAVHQDSEVQALEALAGKKVGTCSECTYDRFLNRELQIPGQEITFLEWDAGEVRTYGTDADAIQDLALGDGVRLDAVLSATATLVEAIENGCGGGCPIRLLGNPVYYDNLAFALDQNRGESAQMLAELEKILAAMHADGTLSQFSMKWYKTDLTKKVGM